MKTPDCRSELAVLARRGRLYPQQETAFSLHLAACAECRLTFKAGAAFDGGATLEADDGMRIARMGIAARRWAEANAKHREAPRARPSRLRVALIAACWCLVAAVASAAVQAIRHSQRVEEPRTPVPVRANASVAAVPRLRSRGFALAPPVVEPAPATERDSVRGATRRAPNAAGRAGDTDSARLGADAPVAQGAR